MKENPRPKKQQRTQKCKSDAPGQPVYNSATSSRPLDRALVNYSLRQRRGDHEQNISTMGMGAGPGAGWEEGEGERYEGREWVQFVEKGVSEKSLRRHQHLNR
jgi:hypothetical protein